MDGKDIQFLLSGGPLNTDPAQSLGGQTSTTLIPDEGNNNLFDDVTREASFGGLTDYRCLYVKLISKTERLKNASIFLRKGTEGAEITLGLSLTNDVQVVTVYGSPVGGSFRLAYTEKSTKGPRTTQTRDIQWIPDIAFMSQRIAALVNSLGNLTGVTCIGQRSLDSYDFILTFAGTGAGRDQELLQISETNGLDVVVTKIMSGGPINRIAPDIGVSNNPPNNVTFMDSAKQEAVKIGTMLPGDFLAIWVRRTVNPGITPIHPDRFDIKVLGDAITTSVLHQVKD